MAIESPEAREPMVGIFWMLGDRLILDASPLNQAETYDDCLGHPTGHDDFWTAQQRVGTVPREVEYLEPPRGRVVYSRKTQRFTFYADRCILKQKRVVKQIMTTMHLPAKQTDMMTDGPDGHYRCSLCLEASGDCEDDDQN